MQINENKEKRIVSVWLTQNESGNNVEELLKPIFQRYKPQKYMVAVFRSGVQALSGLTSELLIYNRRLAAEREVQSEKAKLK